MLFLEDSLTKIKLALNDGKVSNLRHPDDVAEYERKLSFLSDLVQMKENVLFPTLIELIEYV